MATFETEHGRIKYDGRPTALLARYAPVTLTRQCPNSASCSATGPPQKALVEFFIRSKGHSGHEWFGTRMVGTSYVGPWRRDTGKMLAIGVPHRPGNRHAIQLGAGAAHELVHVITLQQTAFNCPQLVYRGG
jgi:hypothetical protein